MQLKDVMFFAWRVPKTPRPSLNLVVTQMTNTVEVIEMIKVKSFYEAVEGFEGFVVAAFKVLEAA